MNSQNLFEFADNKMSEKSKPESPWAISDEQAEEHEREWLYSKALGVIKEYLEKFAKQDGIAYTVSEGSNPNEIVIELFDSDYERTHTFLTEICQGMCQPKGDPPILVSFEGYKGGNKFIVKVT